MPIMAIHVIQDDISHEQLLQEFAKLQKVVRYVLNGQIDFENIRAKGIQTDNLEAGAVTAEKIDVNELSAISANMGTIIAGSITTDAEINVGTDARIGNILYLNETDGDGEKGIVFSTATGKTASIKVQSGDVSISSGGFITLTIGSSQGLVVNQKVTAPSVNGTSSVTINNQPVALESATNNRGYTLSYNSGTKDLSLIGYNGATLSTVSLV